MNDAHSLPDWVAYVFDHPITDPAWYWSPYVPAWDASSESNASFIAETFERSGELLARFTDEQLNQSFWYLVSRVSDFMFVLTEPEVPSALRIRVLRSFVPLFEQVMAVRCTPHLSHLDEQPPNRINSACYMWWDILPICGQPDDPERATFDAEVLAVLRRLLAVPHDACRESALHGIGHWAIYYPDFADIIEDFLARTPDLRPELISYAQAAKVGMIQ